jgi:hypothetical protein
MCPSQASCCVPHPFRQAECAAGRLVDGRRLLALDPQLADEVLFTSSLQCPAEIAPAEAENASHWDSLRLSLQTGRAASTHQQNCRSHHDTV